MIRMRRCDFRRSRSERSRRSGTRSRARPDIGDDHVRVQIGGLIHGGLCVSHVRNPEAFDAANCAVELTRILVILDDQDDGGSSDEEADVPLGAVKSMTLKTIR